MSYEFFCVLENLITEPCMVSDEVLMFHSRFWNGNLEVLSWISYFFSKIRLPMCCFYFLLFSCFVVLSEFFWFACFGLFLVFFDADFSFYVSVWMYVVSNAVYLGKPFCFRIVCLLGFIWNSTDDFFFIFFYCFTLGRSVSNWSGMCVCVFFFTCVCIYGWLVVAFVVLFSLMR